MGHKKDVLQAVCASHGNGSSASFEFYRMRHSKIYGRNGGSEFYEYEEWESVLPSSDIVKSSESSSGFPP
jgi:hypothetical protein